MERNVGQGGISGAGADRIRGGFQVSPGRLLVALQVLSLLALAATVASKLWQDHVWLGWGLAGATVVAWAPAVRRPGFARWWFAYVTGIFVYTLLRSYADETAIPIQTVYPLAVDRALFLGWEPVQGLQQAGFDPGSVGPFDWAAVALHWSFFVVPHAAAVAVYLFSRPAFKAYVVLIVGTMWLGLALFYLLPTAPPWLAAQQGEIDGVFRVMDFVGGSVDSSTYESFYASLGEPNSVAAMPSIHVGVTFALALWCVSFSRRWALPTVVYTALMGVALVYLAEHYVVDLAAGAAVALLALVIARRAGVWPAPADELAPPDPERV